MDLFPLLVPAGDDTEIQYNNDGAFGADSTFTFNNTTKAVTIGNALFMADIAAAGTDVAGFGQLWVKSTTPDELWFTTDAGDDIQLTSGTGGAAGGNDTEVQYNNSGVLSGDSTFAFNNSTKAVNIENLGVGTGIFAPTQDFELRATDGPAVLLLNSLTSNQRAILQFSHDTSLKWDFGTVVVSDDSFYIREGGLTNRLQIAPTTGVLTHTGDGVKVGGYLDVPEISAPATPATNDLRLYTEAIQGFSFFKYLDDTGMKRQLQRDSMILTYNDSGSTIAAARIVYASGSSSNVPTIALAKADALATMPAIGVTIESIANGA
ncbi:MAG: hypothetical protein ACYTBZ_30205, partial [Planctomycetota bacterium]